MDTDNIMPKYFQEEEPQNRPELKCATYLGDGTIVIRGKGRVGHGSDLTRVWAEDDRECIEYKAGQGTLAQGYGPNEEVEYEIRIKPKPKEQKR
mgnify:CR=1 FL=1